MVEKISSPNDLSVAFKDSRTETLAENGQNGGTIPESDITTQTENVFQGPPDERRVFVEVPLILIRVEGFSYQSGMCLANRVFDEGIFGDKQCIPPRLMPTEALQTTQTKEKQNGLQTLSHSKEFQHSLGEKENLGTLWTVIGQFLFKESEKIAIYKARVATEWVIRGICMFALSLWLDTYLIEVDYKDGFIPGLLRHALALSCQFDISNIKTWEENEELYDDFVMQIQAIFTENDGKKRLKETLSDEILNHHGNFLDPSAALNLFSSAHHISEGRFGDGESKIHQTANLLFCHEYPMVEGSNMVMGRITESAPKDLMAPSPGNESPGGGGTASGGFRAGLEDGTSRQRAPPNQARRSYSQRLETFYDVEFYFSNPSPSAHDLSSAGLYLDGIHLICDGCYKRHARSLLVNKDPRSNQFHLMSCVYRRPRPMCQVCLQSPIASLPSEVGRCVQCHHDRQIRAFSDVPQTPEYVPPPVHNSRAFVTQQCVVPECRRQIRTRREQDVCCRCWGVVCDLCVTQRRYHDHP